MNDQISGKGTDYSFVHTTGPREGLRIRVGHPEPDRGLGFVEGVASRIDLARSQIAKLAAECANAEERLLGSTPAVPGETFAQVIGTRDGGGQLAAVDNALGDLERMLEGLAMRQRRLLVAL